MNKDAEKPYKLYRYYLKWNRTGGQADIIARSYEEAEDKLAREIWEYIDDRDMHVMELPD